MSAAASDYSPGQQRPLSVLESPSLTFSKEKTSSSLQCEKPEGGNSRPFSAPTEQQAMRECEDGVEDKGSNGEPQSSAEPPGSILIRSFGDLKSMADHSHSENKALTPITELLADTGEPCDPSGRLLGCPDCVPKQTGPLEKHTPEPAPVEPGLEQTDVLHCEELKRDVGQRSSGCLAELHLLSELCHRTTRDRPSAAVFWARDRPDDSPQERSTYRPSVSSPKLLDSGSSDPVWSPSDEDRNEEDHDTYDDENNCDDDDVFPKLPLNRELAVSLRCRTVSRSQRNGSSHHHDGSDCSSNSSSFQAELEESPLLSPWTESMSQLIQKLEQLNQDIEVALSASSSPSHTPAVSRRKPVKIEAKEACDWLRAAGFPQYAHLYEDSQLPIDISAVKRDHDFLDKDLVEPLYRRLNTLNKCTSMKLDLSLPKKKSDDSDEEDLLAISDRWTFEWSSRRWSRVQDIDCFLGEKEGPCPGGSEVALRAAGSRESVLTDLSEPEVSSLHSESSGGSGFGDLGGVSGPARSASASAMPDLTTLASSLTPEDGPYYNSLPAKSGRHGRTRAKDFLRRMETLRSRGSSSAKAGHKVPVISGPVLQYEPETLRTLPCVDITSEESEDLPSGSRSDGPRSLSGSEGGGSVGGIGVPGLKQCQPRRAVHKRSGVYLEDLDVLTGAPARKAVEQGRRSECRSYEDLVVHVPKDHKPGTFPKALSVENLTPNSAPATVDWHANLRRQPDWAPSATKFCPQGSRVSVYDNVPGSHLYASTGDLMDLEKEDLFPHLDDILQHVSGLQQFVNHWSKNVLPDGEASRQSISQITLECEGNSVPGDSDKDGVSLNDTDSSSTRERRDSGVGASLTRPSRLNWPSFRMSGHVSQSAALLHITSQSVGQLSLLQKFSLLRLTAIMEKYSMSNKHGWTWSVVPKFMKRMKVPDYKDKNVFGVPLIVHVQRYGHPLPLGLQQALHYLRSQCLDQVGLFRKSGVKSRIQALRQLNESSPNYVNYEEQSAYDVADMVKQFFRDLPEPLLTSKLGETFLHIYQYVPKEQRLQAVQAAIMLMSDENREVLQTLLCFLKDVTSLVEENQMTPMNLAVCLAPSLFHLNILKKDNLSPKAMQKKYVTGRLDQKDLNENMAATQGLAHMITECSRLFEIPRELVAQSRNSYVEAELLAPTLQELCKQPESNEGNYQARVEAVMQEMFKEARDRSKAWVSCSSPDATELCYKKVGDGNPLRRWRVSVEVEAPPSEVLNRVLRERHLWDPDLLHWRVRETMDKQTEICQYILSHMAPHPNRDFVVLRSWKMELAKGACALVSVSVDHEDCSPLGSVRGVVLESHYLLEPCGSGKCRLTHICRIDLKGRSPDWYNKAFGYLCTAEAARLKASFQPMDSDGPETKI
ncbi:stAR-related lipid transfer protein 13 isoform X1 [Arapaima gigas]